MSRSGAVAVGVAVIALAGCGSSGHSGSASSLPANGEASKPAAQILADAAAALGSAHGYVIQGEITQAGQTMQVRVEAAGTRSIELSISGGPTRAELLVLPSGAYLRANAAFWSAHLGARAGLIAGRWVLVPPAAAQSFSNQLGHFAPATVARCLVENHGALTVGGKTTVAGRPAIVLRDAGNVPGGGPGTLAVATTGPAYPLQARITGPQHPGGRIDVCNDGKGTSQRGTLTFSQFGKVPPITPPAHPIQLGKTAVV